MSIFNLSSGTDLVCAVMCSFNKLLKHHEAYQHRTLNYCSNDMMKKKTSLAYG